MTGACDKPLRHIHSCRKRHDEEAASSKTKQNKKKNSRLECKNRYPIYYQNGGKTAKMIPYRPLLGVFSFKIIFLSRVFSKFVTKLFVSMCISIVLSKAKIVLNSSSGLNYKPNYS